MPENINEILRIAARRHQEGITIARGTGKRELIYVNDGFVEMTGFSEEESLGRSCSFLQGPETDPGVVQKLRERLNLFQACSFTLRNYRKNKEKFWNRLSITPMEIGRKKYFVGIQSDVTLNISSRRQLDIISTASNIDDEQVHRLVNLLRMLQDMTGNILSNLQYLAFEVQDNHKLSERGLGFVDEIIDTTVDKLLRRSKDELLASYDVGSRQIVRAHEEPQASPIRLLIVDDNPINNLMLSSFLENMGHSVLVATGGEEALELYSRARDVGLVFMDINMPGMDGVECSRALRASYGYKGHIVALTALNAEEVEQMAEPGLFAEMVQKPFDIEHLGVVVERLAMVDGRPAPALGG